MKKDKLALSAATDDQFMSTSSNRQKRKPLPCCSGSLTIPPKNTPFL
jgi:hypothetical protein